MKRGQGKEGVLIFLIQAVIQHRHQQEEVH